MNWQGLEDLYSINESLYECRPDYSPGPDDWVNFQKDVDKMFALRRLFQKFNRTHTFDESSVAELGSGAGGGGPEEGSGEELVEARLTAPAPGRAPPAPPHPARPAPQRKLESVVNDIPERLSDKPAGPAVPPAAVAVAAASLTSLDGGRVLQSNTWAQLEEMEGEAFSGNGPLELETHHNNLLRTHSSPQGPLQPGLGPGAELLGLSLEEEEDIFQAQGYLPFSPQTLSPPTQSPPPTTQTSRPTLQAPPRAALGPPSDFEGSGALPPSLQSDTVRQMRWPTGQ